MCKPKMLNLKTPEGISKIREIVKTGRMSLHQFNSLDTCYRLEIVKDFTAEENEMMFENLSRNTFDVFGMLGDNLDELRENGFEDSFVSQCGLLLVLSKGKCDREMMKAYRSGRKQLNKTLRQPLFETNESLGEQLSIEKSLLDGAIDMDPISVFIGFLWDGLEIEIKDRAVLISELLNRLGIYELTPFLTLKEAEEHLERKRRKADAENELVVSYQAGKDVIYDRIRQHLKKYEKMKSVVKKQ